jgi:hypothetical protein
MGRLVLIWSHLEQLSHMAVQMLLGLPMGEQRILLNGLQIDTIWEHAIAILRLREEEELATWLADWRSRAKTLKDRRNLAVHSWWLPTGDPDAPYKALDAMSRAAKKGVRDNTVPGGGVELSNLNDEINALSAELHSWLQGPLMTVHRHFDKGTEGSNRPL